MPTPGPPGMAVRFPVFRGITARVPSLFPNFSTLVSANENPWDSERRGGCKSRAHFSPEDAGVESTAPNFVQPLRKRVADMKHGFESRRRTPINAAPCVQKSPPAVWGRRPRKDDSPRRKLGT